MANDIEISANWYEQLVADVKRLAFEGIVCTKHAIGKRILEDELKFGKAQYGSRRIENLAKDLQTSRTELYLCMQFVKQYPELSDVSDDWSWRYVQHKLLPAPKAKADTPELPKGKYNILYADPPWEYRDQMRGYGQLHRMAAKQHYPCMSIVELCELPIKQLAADNAVLFLWVISPLLMECAPVIEAFGFEYKTSFVWDKIKHNYGHYNSVRHELLLICTRGSFLPIDKLHDSVISIARSKHSAKPEYFRQLIDTMYPHGKRIELFARGELPAGWDGWGLEYAAVESVAYRDNGAT